MIEPSVTWGGSLSVAALAMNLLVTASAKTHEVLLIIGSAFRERNDVVDLLDRDLPAVLQALLTERMLVNVAGSDLCPAPPVAFAGRVAALELLVVLFHDLGVLLTINTVR